MKRIKKIFGAFLLASGAATFGACGVIPHAYQGNFVDDATGAKLELKSGEGTLTTANGRVVPAKADRLTFEKLQKGEPGIYAQVNEDSKNLLEVYWIAPRPATRQEAGGLIWLETEALYTLMNLKEKDEIGNFEVSHCENGTVLLDPSTKRWQIGCPAGVLRYQFRRVQKPATISITARNTESSS